MELISQLPLIGPLLTWIIPFGIMLGIVIFIHEMGHYLVGRWCGIHAEVFSMGFGKELWSRTDKRGTKWRLAAIPVGGYVKFLGDADASSRTDFDAMHEMAPEDAARSFPGASILRRALTVAAGPFANFILSIVIFAGLVMWQGVLLPGSVIGKVTEVEGIDFVLQPGDEVVSVEGKKITELGELLEYADGLDQPRPLMVVVNRGGQDVELEIPYPQPPLVGTVHPLSPASRAGLEKGDYILEAAGEKLVGFSDLQRVVTQSELQNIGMKVLRDGKELDLTITPREQDIANQDGSFGRKVMIGVSSTGIYYPASVTPAPWTAVWYGIQQVGDVIYGSINGLVHMIMGQIDPSNLQGPIGIAQVSKDMVTKNGVLDYIFLIGLISTAIGMLNLFPIPVLDGGHLMIFAYEAVFGRQPSEKVLQIAMSIGLGMVLLLMFFATYNDIVRTFQVG
jgi:regulator of sigma E protease